MEKVSNNDDKLASLLMYVQAEGRVCPHKWHELWKTLPNKKRVDGVWEPALPLILAAWHTTTPEQKRLRLQEHIEYAARHGILDKVDSFLRNLAPEKWHTIE